MRKRPPPDRPATGDEARQILADCAQLLDQRPAFAAPFTLTPETDTTPRGDQPDLFSADDKDSQV